MQNLILVFNCGSSSLKGAVVDYKTGEIVISYLAEQLNSPEACLTIKFKEEKALVDLSDNSSHDGAIQALMQSLNGKGLSQMIKAVGHRVVHGGEKFKDSVIVTQEVLDTIDEIKILAPLHNPAHLIGIRAAMKAFNEVQHVAVFDTAFHQSMAEKDYLYAIPYEYYQKYALRKYGMHGTSYRYVSGRAEQFLQAKNLPARRLMIAHLGNGASLCAVKDGKSIDTTMGLTPLEGLMMGTRSGNIDANIFSFLHENANMDIQSTTDLLNKKSGLLGVSGVSNDLRIIHQAIKEGNKLAKLALDMFIGRVAKLTASMVVSMGGLDAFVFTGGIGENDKVVRKGVLEQLEVFGLKVDSNANETLKSDDGIGFVTQKNTGPVALVIPTNEELMIARDTAKLIGLSV